MFLITRKLHSQWKEKYGLMQLSFIHSMFSIIRLYIVLDIGPCY